MSRAIETRASFLLACDRLADHIEAAWIGDERAAEKLKSGRDICEIIEDLDELRDVSIAHDFKRRLSAFFRAANGLE